jgi:hypothetical protein
MQINQTKRSAPQHIIRARCYLDLPRDIFITVNGDWHSSFYQTYEYNYEELKYIAQESTKTSNLGPGAGVRLDFSIEKRFFNNRLAVSFWGRNVLVSNKVDSYLWFTQAYPQTINRMFGMQIGYTFF